MLHFQNNGARGVCTIFAIFFGHCDGVTAFSYALFDAAAMIRRQLSTILLETCTPGTSVSSLSPAPLFLSGLSYLRLLAAIG